MRDLYLRRETVVDVSSLSAERFATGLRNGEGIAFDSAGRIFATQHGRDQLRENWSALYTAEQGVALSVLVDKIEAPDPTTVVFRLKFATNALLPALAGLGTSTLLFAMLLFGAMAIWWRAPSVAPSSSPSSSSFP